MTIRLYDSAWVMLLDFEAPQQVKKDRTHPAVFHIGGFRYDIDGRAVDASPTVPEITRMLNMQTVRELGLSTQYAGSGDVRL